MLAIMPRTDSITSQVHADLAAHSECLHRGRASDWTLLEDIELLATYWTGVKVKDIKVRKGHNPQAAKDRLRKLRSVLSSNVVDGMHTKNTDARSDMHKLVIKMMLFLKETAFQEGCAAARQRLDIVPAVSADADDSGEIMLLPCGILLLASCLRAYLTNNSNKSGNSLISSCCPVGGVEL